ncbi:MAG: VCBS repeat-containing protein, partial [Verrucomicrobia bacterium]|nr:VCBS repeat-containing protein [Verrucomicrobiota bacterium]
MALADIDGDGDLDLYVTHYRAATAKDAPVPVRLRQIDGRWQVPQEHQERFVAEVNASGDVGILELGEPDALYINDGKVRFTLASWTEGRFVDEEGKPLNAPPRDWGLAAMFRDINQDGFPDLYVCNDFYTPDRIWINRSNGTFRAFGALAIRKTPWASMAVDFSDINRDGLDEIFVAEMLSRELERRQTHRSLSELDPMPSWGWGWRPGDLSSRSQVMRNTLLLNRGDNTFAEIGQFSGVHASDWTWGVTFLDVDLDGYEDLLIANGHSLDLADSDSVAVLNQIKDPNDPRRRTRIHEVFKPLHVAKNAFRNRGDLMFQEMGEQWNFNEASAANGMALADLDNDGDLDVVLNNFDAPASILQNQAAAPRIAI